MAEVTGFTADRMRIIENETVVDGEVQGDNLILIRRDGVPIDAGNVRGPVGPIGPPIADGNKGDITVSATGGNWQINPAVVTNAELATMAANTVKGVIVAGAVADLSMATLAAALPLPQSVNGQVGAVIAPRIFATFELLNQWAAPHGTQAFTSDGTNVWEFRRQGTPAGTGSWVKIPKIHAFSTSKQTNQWGTWEEYLPSGGNQWISAVGTSVQGRDYPKNHFVNGEESLAYLVRWRAWDLNGNSSGSAWVGVAGIIHYV